MQTSAALPPMVDAETIAAMLEQNGPLTIIDVRTPAEFEAAHIPGSDNVPLDLLPEHRAEPQDALRDPALLVCRSGTRARQAAEVLAGLGLPGLHVLDGGISAWEAAGKEIRRGRQRWALDRQVRGLAGGLGALGVLGGLTLGRPLLSLAGAVGGGLAFSALTDSCALGMLLSRLPYNRGASCAVAEVVTRLATAGEDRGTRRRGSTHTEGARARGSTPRQSHGPARRPRGTTTRHRERTHSHESTRSFYSPVSCGGPG